MIGEFIKIESNLTSETTIGRNNIEYTKKKVLIPLNACVVARNNIVCDIQGKQNARSYDMEVNYSGQYYKISFWEPASNWGGIASIAEMATTMIKEKSLNIQETLLPKIFDANGQQVGKMECVVVKKEGITQTYDYYKLVLNGVELKCYIVERFEGNSICYI